MSTTASEFLGYMIKRGLHFPESKIRSRVREWNSSAVAVTPKWLQRKLRSMYVLFDGHRVPGVRRTYRSTLLKEFHQHFTHSFLCFFVLPIQIVELMCEF